MKSGRSKRRKPVRNIHHPPDGCPDCHREGEIRGLLRAARKFKQIAKRRELDEPRRAGGYEGAAYEGAAAWCRSEAKKLRGCQVKEQEKLPLGHEFEPPCGSPTSNVAGSAKRNTRKD